MEDRFGSLITPNEAEEVVEAQKSRLSLLRTPLMILVGLIMASVLTLLIMTLFSLKGVKTGLEGTLPIFGSKPSRSLQF